jgi:hypothetical protein
MATTTRHTITANQSGTYNGMDYDIEYEITFTFLPGAAATFDDPGYGPEIDFVSISPDAGDHGGFTDLAQRDLVEWAEDWLDEHHAECCDLAETEREPDPDYQRDLAAEYRREERG